MDYSHLLDEARALQEQLRNWRRQLHRYPELSFQETKTAQFVGQHLDSLNIPYKTGVAKTGIVAVLEGSGSKTVGLRADMDALPIQEENDSDFNSEYPGRMHACGHDAHTAMLLGAATLLKQKADKGELNGNIKLLFQPSEEDWDEQGKSGGRYMVEEGALEGLDAVFGLHVEAALGVGQVSTREGPMLAAVDDFELTLRGLGGHAAEPHLTTDVIALSGLVINAIHQIVSRRIDPMQHGLITIGSIHGGQASNVIDSKVTMTGTIRSLSEATRAKLQQELGAACALVKAFGADYELKIQQGYPVTSNHPEVTVQSIKALESLLGRSQVKEAPVQLGSEDFSFMAQVVPACFVMLGVRNPSWSQDYPVHTSTFRIDEDALAIGTASLCALALKSLEANS
ncbi:MAG: amidohydrolase [Trueperaceae bacterium]|nr:amidohydrolase [Trueperaceae bacterium]